MRSKEEAQIWTVEILKATQDGAKSKRIDSKLLSVKFGAIGMHYSVFKEDKWKNLNFVAAINKSWILASKYLAISISGRVNIPI